MGFFCVCVTASATKQLGNDVISARGAFWIPLFNTGPAQLANYLLEMVIQWLLSTGLWSVCGFNMTDIRFSRVVYLLS